MLETLITVLIGMVGGCATGFFLGAKFIRGIATETEAENHQNQKKINDLHLKLIETLEADIDELQVSMYGKKRKKGIVDNPPLDGEKEENG